VTSSTGGIDCRWSGGGTRRAGTCTDRYARGSTVTLRAAPAAGNVFAGWDGPCTTPAATPTCTLPIREAQVITARFAAAPTPPPAPPRAAAPAAPYGSGAAPGAPYGSEAAPAVEAIPATLARIKRLTDPDQATPATARTALGAVRQLLPQLSTAADSVEARLYEVEAHLRLEDSTAACGVLRQIREPAAGTRFSRSVAHYWSADGLGCSSGYE
jgi:hypothetical protein